MSERDSSEFETSEFVKTETDVNRNKGSIASFGNWRMRMRMGMGKVMEDKMMMRMGMMVTSWRKGSIDTRGRKS